MLQPSDLAPLPDPNTSPEGATAWLDAHVENLRAIIDLAHLADTMEPPANYTAALEEQLTAGLPPWTLARLVTLGVSMLALERRGTPFPGTAGTR